MSKIIKYYPETITQYNYINNLKLLKQKMWKSTINNFFSNKTDISNLFVMTEFFMKKIKLYKYSYNYLNKLVIPENILNIIKKNISLKDIPDFIPSKFIFDNITNDKLIDSIILSKMNKNFGFDLNMEFVLLQNFIINELSSFIQQNIDCKENISNIKSFNEIMKFHNMLVLFSKNNNDIILFNEYLLIVFTDNYILFLLNDKYLNNFLLLVNGKIYLKNNDIKMVKISKKVYIDNEIMYKCYGYIKNANQSQIFNYSIDTNLIIKNIYEYMDKQTKLNIKFHETIFHKKKISISKYIKNECEFEEYYNYNTKLKQIVSQCMIKGNEKNGSELRFRGKYTGISSNCQNIKKTITIEDKIVYEKEGDKIKTNLLVDKKKYFNRTEMIIGYKVAKSANGELRIVKLGITTDAQIVVPIDEEYFINHNKERCDKAIVMDIQYPNREEEISVVPYEMIAYSYIYENNNFDYKVGMEVIPDAFNSNEDVGCAQGIHYFQSRLDVFKAYIDNK